MISSFSVATLSHFLTSEDGPFGNKQSLNPESFTPYKVSGKDDVSSSSTILTLTGPLTKKSSAILRGLKDSIISVEVKQPQLQIARAYTPLPTISPDEDDDLSPLIRSSPLRLLIKREERGEVSKYLHNLPDDAQTEVRGPKEEFRISDDIQEVLFIAGGTGIAPALQVASVMRNRSFVKMHILWANRKEEDCAGNDIDDPRFFKSNNSLVKTRPHPVVEQLDDLKDQWIRAKDKHLRVDYYVDEKNWFIGANDVQKLVARSSINQDATKKRLILVSGPDGFVEHWAGSKIWQDGQEIQGSLKGVLGQLNLNGWHVWKL